MKKVSIFLFAALAMISCGNSYKAQDVALNNETDSINFAVGLVNGLQLKMYTLANDSSDEAVARRTVWQRTPRGLTTASCISRHS